MVETYISQFTCTSGHRLTKGRCHLRTRLAGTEGTWKYSPIPVAVSPLEGSGWSVSHPGRLTSGIDLVPFVQGAGWVLGAGVENPAFIRIQTLDCPACSMFCTDCINRLSK
jgi:hypothetical protein